MLLFLLSLVTHPLPLSRDILTIIPTSSPEMCEGKVYDEKSDIWALGCIVYEMACLQKTFEGSNLPALVNKIMRGQFAPIRGDYTPQFKQLVRDLLQKDPEFRPTASEVLLSKLPELQALHDQRHVKYDPTTQITCFCKTSTDQIVITGK